MGPVTSVMAGEIGAWPRDVKVDSGTITVYEPQLDSLKGDSLTGRAAVAYKAKAGGEYNQCEKYRPQYGFKQDG